MMHGQRNIKFVLRVASICCVASGQNDYLVRAQICSAQLKANAFECSFLKLAHLK